MCFEESFSQSFQALSNSLRFPRKLNISMPINFFHEVHVSFNSMSGEFEVSRVSSCLGPLNGHFGFCLLFSRWITLVVSSSSSSDNNNKSTINNQLRFFYFVRVRAWCVFICVAHSIVMQCISNALANVEQNIHGRKKRRREEEQTTIDERNRITIGKNVK